MLRVLRIIAALTLIDKLRQLSKNPQSRAGCTEALAARAGCDRSCQVGSPCREDDPIGSFAAQSMLALPIGHRRAGAVPNVSFVASGLKGEHRLATPEQTPSPPN